MSVTEGNKKDLEFGSTKTNKDNDDDDDDDDDDDKIIENHHTADISPEALINVSCQNVGNNIGLAETKFGL